MSDKDKALVERLREGVDNDGYDFLIEMADAGMREAADRIEALSAENERLREALRTVEQGVPRPVGRSWFPDGRPSKHDQCIHGIWVYEPCEGCTDAFIAAALGETE